MAELALALRDLKTEGTTTKRTWWLLLPALVLSLGAIFWTGNKWASRTTKPPASIGDSVTVSEPQSGTFNFDGRTRIVTPVLRSLPITLEAWVNPNRSQGTEFVLSSDIYSEFGLGLGTINGLLHVTYLSSSIVTNQKIPEREWSHLAATFTKQDTRCFLNGKLVHISPASTMFGEAPFIVGGMGRDSRVYQFNGRIRSVRISNRDRFFGDFTPETELSSDESSVLIYDGRCVDGNKILDLSGRGNHGHWEKSEPSDPPTRLPKNVLIFDGRNSISTPVDRDAPMTLEAWALPVAYPKNCGFIFGSDVSSKYGIGLGLCGTKLGAEYLDGLQISESVVPLHTWGHFSAVFGEQDTRLYINGKRVNVGPPTKISGGTSFVIGRLGPNNPIDFFVGQIRCLRICRGERYTADFEPEFSFKSDVAHDPHRAVLIFDGSKVEEDRVIDLSGSGNDGKWTQFQ